MDIAAQIGISPRDFWKMTPKELSIYARAHSARIERDYKQQYQMSIVTAALTAQWAARSIWGKRINPDKLLNALTPEEPQKTMTDGDMLAQVKALHARMGGK